jgi:Arc/MetJ-type ribon-helix-helix transcriptional regulator
MIRTQVQLTQEQAARLRALAQRRGTSMAELIRQAVDGLADESAKIERHQRALAVIGRFRSTDRNVARDHDRHLAEAYRR